MRLSIILCGLALISIPLVLSIVVLASKRVRSDSTGLFTKQRLLSWFGIASWFPALLMVVFALFSLSNSDFFITLASFLFLVSYAFSVASAITLYVRRSKITAEVLRPSIGSDPKRLS